MLLPTWSIVPSRIWKAQVPYLARRFRVVTFDGRGSGRSDRPTGAAAYTNEEYAADTVAVMDAVGVDRAVLVGLSCGAAWAVHVAAGHPERVLGLFAIAPSCGFSLPCRPGPRARARTPSRCPAPRAGRSTTSTTGSAAATTTSCEFFFAQMFHEPHSTKQLEDAVRVGARQVAPQTLVDCTAGRLGLRRRGLHRPRARCARP